MVTIRQFRGLVERTRENFLGSDGTGLEGNMNRVFTLTTIFVIDDVEVYLDGLLLRENTQYNFNSSNKQITILVPVWNNQLLSAFYDV